MNYYRSYYNRFLASSEENRQKSKTHWIKCHQENLESGNESLIIFSAQILAMIALAEETLNATNAE